MVADGSRKGRTCYRLGWNRRIQRKRRRLFWSCQSHSRSLLEQIMLERHSERKETGKNRDIAALFSLFSSIQTILGRLTLIVSMISMPSAGVHACGGCFRLPYQSLLEKVERGDRVVVAHATDPTGSTWKIDRVIKGRKSDSDETILDAAAVLESVIDATETVR